MFFQHIVSEFGAGFGWSFAPSAVNFFLPVVFPVDNLVWGKNLLCLSFVSGHQGLHDQSELKEGIGMLRTDILPQCFASSIRVHRSTIRYHKHRLCETRKNYENTISDTF